MSHWQLRLQRKFQSEPNGFFKAFLISFFVHVLIFIVPFLFIKQAGIIIIDSSGKYNLPVYYKYSGGSGSGSGTGSGKNVSGSNSLGGIKTGSSVTHNINQHHTSRLSDKMGVSPVRRGFKSGARDSAKKTVVVKKESREIDTNSFLKLKKFNKKQVLSNKNNKIKSNSLEKNLSKTKKNKSLNKLNNKTKKINQVESAKASKNIQHKEDLKATTIIEEKLDEKISTVENGPEVNSKNLENLSAPESNLSGVSENSGDNFVLNSGDSLVISGDGSGDGSGSGMMGGFGIEGYLHSDGELVNNIRNAVGKNWSRPKGFSSEVYCEFKILVSQDGKSVTILEQKNSKVPAFNIQARGAILKTEFPEKCWNKELTLVLR